MSIFTFVFFVFNLSFFRSLSTLCDITYSRIVKLRMIGKIPDYWNHIVKTTFDAHTDPIFQNLGILKFHDIYLIQLGLFMYSYQNHTLPLKFHCKFTLQSQIHSRNTRNWCNFRLPFCRTRTKQFSVFIKDLNFTTP